MAAARGGRRSPVPNPRRSAGGGRSWRPRRPRRGLARAARPSAGCSVIGGTIVYARRPRLGGSGSSSRPPAQPTGRASGSSTP
eukprot:4477296-Alexandrium_andersonii.AAC.1